MESEMGHKYLDIEKNATASDIIVTLLSSWIAYFCWRVSKYANKVRGGVEPANRGISKTMDKKTLFRTYAKDFALFIMPLFLVYTTLELGYVVNAGLLGYGLGKFNEAKKIEAKRRTLEQNKQERSIVDKKRDGAKKSEGKKAGRKETLIKCRYITMYRGIMMVITCFAILGIDFSIYPRRFGKTETYGNSVMDVGVGCFVFAAGVVGARRYLKERILGKRIGIVEQMVEGFKSSMELIVLGLLRLYFTKKVGYDVNVKEYGVHWNFFFTLGALPIMVPIIRGVRKIDYRISMVVILVGYQVMLTWFGLEEFILYGERVDLISKNKEGIFSSIGYVCVYLAGMALGEQLLSSKRDDEANKFRRMMGGWVVLFVGYRVIDGIVGLRMSRRMANMAYCVWTILFNVAGILILKFIDEITTIGEEVESDNDNDGPLLIEAINYNSLSVFLVANVSTGMVNLGFREFIPPYKALLASDWVAYLVLFIYMVEICAVAIVLKCLNLKIR